MKTSTYNFISIFFVSLMLFSCSSGGDEEEIVELAVASKLETFNLIHDGENRSYNVYTPKDFDDSNPVSVVFNLHGAGGTAKGQMDYARMNVIADHNNFIIIYPQGLRSVSSWGATEFYWNSYFGTGVDDVGFFDVMIDEIIGNYNVDKKRIYSMGYSNGGYMSYRLACELNDRIAGIVSVAGTMAGVQPFNCDTDTPVSVMAIHGTSDATVKYVSDDPSFNLSVEDAVDFWVTKNKCNASPEETSLPNNDTTDGSTITKLVYKSGENGTEVQLLRVNGGHHTWPGGSGGYYTNKDISASQVAWDFLKRFEHPNPR